MPDFNFENSAPLVLSAEGVISELPTGAVIIVLSIDSISGLSTELSLREHVLGNPTVSGQFLTSTTNGERSWVTPSALKSFFMAGW